MFLPQTISDHLKIGFQKRKKKKIICFRHNFFLSQIVSTVRGLSIAIPQDVETVATSDRQPEFLAGEREDLVCCAMREAAVKMYVNVIYPSPCHDERI